MRASQLRNSYFACNRANELNTGCAGHRGKRSLNFDRESRPTVRGFSQKQDCNLLERTTKLRSPGCFIAQDRHLGRDKRMLEQMNITGYARLIHRNDLNRAALAGDTDTRRTAVLHYDEKKDE